MINFGNHTIVQDTWPNITGSIVTKKLQVQYTDDTIKYSIFAIDNSVMYKTVIYKSTIPAVFLQTQPQNDAYKTDFETNYKPTANARLQMSITTTGSLPVTGSVAIVGNVGVTGSIVATGPHLTGSTFTTNPVVIAGVNSSKTVQVPQVDTILGQTVPQMSVAATLTSPGLAPRGGYAYVNAYGSLRVSPESSILFNDPFDGLVFDNNRWITTGSGGGTVTIGGGSASISAGTSANAFAYIQSRPTFVSYGTTFEIFGAVAAFFGSTTGNYSFLGIGTPKPAPTATSPLFDGIGFEYDLTGTFKACVYSSGSSVYKSAALTSPGMTPQRMGFQLRPDTVIFYYQTTEYPAASISFTGSYIQALPILNLSINNTSSVGSATGIWLQNQSINDSGRNNVAISDGVYTWRKATVDASGSILIAGNTITGSTLQVNPVTISGVDLNKAVRAFVTDTSGSLFIATNTITGSTLQVNPVTIAGVDSNKAVRSILTDFTGSLITITQPTTKILYSATSGSITPAATPSDIVTITGSATKLVRVLRFVLSTTQGATGINNWYMVKRSTADSAGTSTTATIVPNDSQSPAATAVVRQYTVNPTLGTAVGTVSVAKVAAPINTASMHPPYIFDFVNSGLSSGILLRGTSEQLCLNFNGAALPGTLNIAYTVEFSEE